MCIAVWWVLNIFLIKKLVPQPAFRLTFAYIHWRTCRGKRDTNLLGAAFQLTMLVKALILCFQAGVRKAKGQERCGRGSFHPLMVLSLHNDLDGMGLALLKLKHYLSTRTAAGGRGQRGLITQLCKDDKFVYPFARVLRGDGKQGHPFGAHPGRIGCIFLVGTRNDNSILQQQCGRHPKV